VVKSQPEVGLLLHLGGGEARTACATTLPGLGIPIAIADRTQVDT
jgi:hypothetical protein